MRLFLLFVLVSIVVCQSPTPTPTASPVPNPTTPPTTQPNLPPECLPGSTVPKPPNVICPTIGGVSGVIAVSNFRSCAYYAPNLNCGDNQNVTVLDIGINPGTGNDVQYTFTTVPSPNSSPQSNNNGNQCTGGTCSVLSEQLTLTVKSSPLVVYYELADIDLEVPFAYASFFSAVFDGYNDNPPGTCGGTANVQNNIKCLNVTSSCKPEELGIQFSHICNFAIGNTKACTTLSELNPFGGSSGSPNWPWVGNCYSGSGGDDDGNSYKACLESVSDQTTNLFGSSKVDRQVMCDMPAPSTACFKNAGCTEPDGNCIFGMVEPPATARWDTPYSFNGDTNAENDANVDDSGNPHTIRTGPCKRSEVDDDGADDGDAQCQRKFMRLAPNSVCRFFFGNWFYMGRAPQWKMNPNQQTAKFCSSDDDVNQYGGVMSIRPVMPGCGGSGTLSSTGVLPPFFPYGLSPTTFRNNDPNDIVGPYTVPHGGVNACGPSDNNCCVSSVQTEDSGGIAYVQCVPGVNKDGKGGAQPNCPANVNPNICPVCAIERTGLVDATGGTHYTASAIGKMYPLCKVYQIRPAPNPVFTINATIVQGGAQADFVNITNVVMAQNCVQGTGTDKSQCYQQTSSPLVGQVATSANHSMLIEIVGIDSTTGSIGSELNGFIVVCNQSGSGPGIFMGNANDITINPWKDIISNDGIGIRNQQGKRIAFTPWPELLGLNTTIQNNKGVWFYYVPEQKMNGYGTGCGQNGIQNRYYANTFNANFLCKECRNTCVPGFMQCEDWTLQDRITDLVKNSSTTEILIRDNMQVHTPCQISSYYHQWMAVSENCQEFIDAYRSFGYLPPNWVDESTTGLDSGPCPAPLYYVNGNKLIYQDPTLQSNNLYVRLKVTVDGELYDVQQDISSGCFSQPKITPNTPYCLKDTGVQPGDILCGVIQNSNDGQMKMFVANTGTLPGDYTVIVQCSQGSGITQNGAPVFEIAPNSQPVLVQVPLRHSGVIPTSTTCTFNLTHPIYGILFDTLVTSGCSVVASSSSLPVVSYNATNACQSYGMDCPVPQEPTSSAVAWGFILFILAFCLMFVGICCISAIRSSTSETNQKINALKANKPIVKAISSQPS